MSRKLFDNTTANTFNEEYFTRMLRYFGRLLDFDIEGYEEFLNFQEQLEKIDNGKSKKNWDVEQLLMDLTPSCSDLLIYCEFNKTVENCTDIFQFKRTSLGYCCIFNTIRPEKLEDQ